MSRYDLTRQELSSLLDGEPGYRLEQVWGAMYTGLLDPAAITTLPRSLRARLAAEPALAPAFTEAAESVSDAGQTRKWLLVAADGNAVEAVLMRYRHRLTVCVSSQAGCAMGCGFCATGQAGYFRQLSPGEMTEQLVLANRKSLELGWGRVSNIVLMGMGEPLANYRNVMAALHAWNEHMGVGARSITVSTVGIVPGIVRLAAEALQVNLAVSLHAANDELRSELVPVNRRYPLAKLMEACRAYVDRTHRRLSFEWACISGVNDRLSDAVELAALAGPLGAHVNLIPLNPTPGYLVAGSPLSRVRSFRDELVSRGVNSTIRHTRGREVDGACGQLAGAAQVTARARLA
ncbi:MAG TPA: 23S rRNA (adenine(2503)-C(2))-methyltransferase RlmN [Acidimicrobiales bacterium]|jgi:23S rRNA (adenine2503-C2)-methyltransferase|nr:23S rRNA (adenine(2503)-C(2))-methyltransferase RlmN [Acidimicrobiales bacterium]